MTLNEAISAIALELSESGIDKTRTMIVQGREKSFRGIEEVQAATSVLMAKHGVIVYPHNVRDLVREERATSGGRGVNIWTIAIYEFGVRGHGEFFFGSILAEAFDNGDKGCAKVASVAYREFLLKLFNVPVKGQPQIEDDDPSPEPRVAKEPPRKQDDRPSTDDVPRFPARWDYEQGEWAGRAMREAEPYVLTTYIAECHKWLNAPGLADSRRLIVTLSKESAEYALQVALANEATKKG